MKPRLRAFLFARHRYDLSWGARSLTVQLSLLCRLPPFFVKYKHCTPLDHRGNLDAAVRCSSEFPNQLA